MVLKVVGITVPILTLASQSVLVALFPDLFRIQTFGETRLVVFATWLSTGAIFVLPLAVVIGILASIGVAKAFDRQ